MQFLLQKIKKNLQISTKIGLLKLKVTYNVQCMSKNAIFKVICTALSDVNWVTLNSHGSWAALLDTVLSTSVSLHLHIWASIDNSFYTYYNCVAYSQTCTWEYLTKIPCYQKKAVGCWGKKDVHTNATS